MKSALNLRSAFVVSLVSFLAVQSVHVMTQAPAATASRVLPPRAIRRDVPMTNAIKAAFAAGTRDASGRPGKNYWQQQVDYTINVSLDPARHTLTGTETIAYRNNSPSELTQIVLRLDHNIFRERTPFAASWRPSQLTDGMVLTRVAVNGAVVDLNAAPAGGGRGRGGAPGAQGTTPDRRLTMTGLTTTLATINLATPIAAKSAATIEISWHTELPGGPDGSGHRMTQRYGDELFQPTQWYPRVAVYDDLRGWERQAYLGPSEFYNNFGKFDVSIDVPAGWLVSGTGVLQNPKDVLTDKAIERLSHVLESDKDTLIVGDDEFGPGASTKAGARLTWHMVADQVNDFAWLTGKRLIWKATRATIPGKGPIPVHMLYQADHASLYQNAGPVARHALEFYSKLWMPYSFPQFTLQDGPSAGMEYPMVINSNQGAADHETGHQWWPMTVSNNETWYGWMDEGFNQYMNILSAADTQKQAPNLDGRGQSYGRTSGNEDEPPMMWNANFAGSMYSFQTYSKTPLMLSSLGGVVGDQEVWRAQSEFAKAWAFKHPSPWDYMFFMGNELKQDLGWFWNPWLFGTDAVDGSIETVTTAGTKTTVVVKQDGQMASPVVLEFKLAKGAALKPAAGTSPKIEMKDADTMIATWPADVWFSGARSFSATVDTGGRKVESVMFDPNCRFPDHDPSDNVWPKGARPGTCGR